MEAESKGEVPAISALRAHIESCSSSVSPSSCSNPNPTSFNLRRRHVGPCGLLSVRFPSPATLSLSCPWCSESEAHASTDSKQKHYVALVLAERGRMLGIVRRFVSPRSGGNVVPCSYVQPQLLCTFEYCEALPARPSTSKFPVLLMGAAV
jgi:hypothetical protein